jgi:hypothetical protein
MKEKRGDIGENKWQRDTWRGSSKRMSPTPTYPLELWGRRWKTWLNFFTELAISVEDYSE